MIEIQYIVKDSLRDFLDTELGRWLTENQKPFVVYAKDDSMDIWKGYGDSPKNPDVTLLPNQILHVDDDGNMSVVK